MINYAIQPTIVSTHITSIIFLYHESYIEQTFIFNDLILPSLILNVPYIERQHTNSQLRN